MFELGHLVLCIKRYKLILIYFFFFTLSFLIFAP